ncbi:rhodanese-like domain-containing protein [Roseobacteraceae bacterium NS-SX3]
MPQKGEPASFVSRRGLMLGGLAAAGAAAAGWGWLRRVAPKYAQPRLSAAEAYARAQAGEVVLIDIRTPREWRATGVPAGGRPIDMRRPDFAAALQAVAGPDRAAPIALICARGVRSARMTLALAEAGFTSILDVPEGMLGSRAGPGWIAAGLPVVAWDG